MKKFLTALTFVGFAAVGQASSIQLSCSPNPLIVAANSTVDSQEICNTSDLVGSTINSIFVDLTFDFLTAGSNTAGAAASFSFNLPGTSVDFDGLADLANRPVNNGGQFVDSGEFSLWNAGPSITILDSFSGNSPISGGSFSKIITVDYTPGVPEPASLALMGSGLLGLGIMVRRRKK